ncbi:hypothetical protein DFP72DRAFT_1072817 [Ephemerocybe angulata]|uniref:Uncharacterized protein n=1 Tax=Ephemerocybe angulata TaxID=980116 RepID=A0A8H6HNL0_9AGAR|nr:hypothetical protein DFP72DRAFT_1072817 [Tulosesus angulatus]
MTSVDASFPPTLLEAHKPLLERFAHLNFTKAFGDHDLPSSLEDANALILFVQAYVECLEEERKTLAGQKKRKATIVVKVLQRNLEALNSRHAILLADSLPSAPPSVEGDATLTSTAVAVGPLAAPSGENDVTLRAPIVDSAPTAASPPPPPSAAAAPLVDSAQTTTASPPPAPLVDSAPTAPTPPPPAPLVDSTPTTPAPPPPAPLVDSAPTAPAPPPPASAAAPLVDSAPGDASHVPGVAADPPQKRPAGDVDGQPAQKRARSVAVDQVSNSVLTPPADPDVTMAPPDPHTNIEDQESELRAASDVEERMAIAQGNPNLFAVPDSESEADAEGEADAVGEVDAEGEADAEGDSDPEIIDDGPQGNDQPVVDQPVDDRMVTQVETEILEVEDVETGTVTFEEVPKRQYKHMAKYWSGLTPNAQKGLLEKGENDQTNLKRFNLPFSDQVRCWICREASYMAEEACQDKRVAASCLINTKGQTSCVFHVAHPPSTKHDNNARKDAKIRVTGVPFVPQKLPKNAVPMLLPMVHLSPTPEDKPTKGTKRNVRDPVDRNPNFTLDRVLDFFPLSPNGETRVLHCGCALDTALMDFYIFKKIYITSTSKHREELYGRGMAPRDREVTFAYVQSLGIRPDDSPWADSGNGKELSAISRLKRAKADIENRIEELAVEEYERAAEGAEAAKAAALKTLEDAYVDNGQKRIDTRVLLFQEFSESDEADDESYVDSDHSFFSDTDNPSESSFDEFEDGSIDSDF